LPSASAFGRRPAVEWLRSHSTSADTADELSLFPGLPLEEVQLPGYDLYFIHLKISDNPVTVPADVNYFH